MQERHAPTSQAGDVTLLRSVAEQLKTPLALIARQAELGELLGDMQVVDVASIRTQATTALSLVEGYLLGLQLLYEQSELALEPVSVSSLLVDVAHELDSFAKQYDTGLQLRIAGRYEPAMAHARGLRSALLSLGYALLENYPAENKTLTLALHRTPHGLVTGIYGDYPSLRSQQWRQAMQLQGRAQQPFRALTSGSGAGLFVAQTILQAMAAQLRVGRHLHQFGLATTLQASQQLQFV